MYHNYHYADDGWLEPTDENLMRGCINTFLGWLLVVAALFILCAFTSCTSPRTVLVETIRTDTLHLTEYRRDSIFIHTAERDSVALTQRGDTILIDRWHTRTLTEYRDRWLHDSIYVASHDTIPAPYPVERLVEKELTWHQQLRLHLANAILLALTLALLIWLWKRRTWWLTRIRRMI